MVVAGQQVRRPVEDHQRQQQCKLFVSVVEMKAPGMGVKVAKKEQAEDQAASPASGLRAAG